MLVFVFVFALGFALAIKLELELDTTPSSFCPSRSHTPRLLLHLRQRFARLPLNGPAIADSCGPGLVPGVVALLPMLESPLLLLPVPVPNSKNVSTDEADEEGTFEDDRERSGFCVAHALGAVEDEE